MYEDRQAAFRRYSLTMTGYAPPLRMRRRDKNTSFVWLELLWELLSPFAFGL